VGSHQQLRERRVLDPPLWQSAPADDPGAHHPR